MNKLFLSILNGSPLAFGEGNVKGRIKNVLNYKKPRFWVTLAAVIITAIVGIGLLANPHGSHPDEVSDSMNELMKQIQIEITRKAFDELLQYVYKNEITEDSKNIKVNLDDIEQKYNFTFEVPSNWKNKYKIIENDGYVSFVYTEYKLEDESYQEFFGIAVMRKEDYEEALEDAPMPGILLAENDNLAYVLYTPIDLAIMDSQKAEEYKQLYLSNDQII
jgi:hypothetical protein